jgi:hypothetical protein
MKEPVIKTLNEFNDFIKDNCGIATLYRGVTKKEYELIPSLGRYLSKHESAEELLREEKNMMRLFRTNSYCFIKDPQICELELLAIAQHHGLRTRLLDWTRSALIALYFAVENNLDCDGAIYIHHEYRTTKFIDGLKAKDIDPYKIDKDYFFIPLTSTNRITAQKSCFLLFNDPLEKCEMTGIEKLIIPKINKYDIQLNLAKLGIDRSTISPDLDGLASYLNWVKKMI